MNMFRYAENLSLFVAVAGRRSFSAVARANGAAPSSVARQIDTLEEELGTRLFLRSTRGLELTDAGEMLLARANQILSALVDIRAEIAAIGDEPEGVLRVACLPTFGRRHLLPLLPGLLGDYPKLEVEFDFTERPMDPVQERMDLVIRIGRLKDSSLYATRIGTQRWVACASPGYLANRGRPDNPAQLDGHLLLDKRRDAGCWRMLPQHTGRVVLRCDDYEALLQATITGLGLAFLPFWVVSHAVRSGQLTIVFGGPDSLEDEIHALRALPRASAKVQVLTQRLQAALGQNL
jgi:DNA-binding transcriptional LysR family regulator